MVRRTQSTLMAGLAFAVVLTACGSNSEGDGTQVVATTGIVAALAERAAGQDAQVTQLVPDGTSAHDFELSAEDRQILEEADLIAFNGAGLESGIPVDEADAPKWSLTENAGDPLPFEEGGEDPHVWMDPARTASALGSLGNAMGEVDPENAAAYDGRVRRYETELRDLDRELEATLDAVPPGERELVTSHDSLGYFADRYGLEVVATPFPASGPEAEASPARLAEVLDAIEAHGVATVFAAEEDDPEVLHQISEEADVTVVDDLLVESLGDAGTYEEMLRRDAELISGALAAS